MSPFKEVTARAPGLSLIVGSLSNSSVKLEASDAFRIAFDHRINLLDWSNKDI